MLAFATIEVEVRKGVRRETGVRKGWCEGQWFGKLAFATDLPQSTCEGSDVPEKSDLEARP